MGYFGEEDTGKKAKRIYYKRKRCGRGPRGLRYTGYRKAKRVSVKSREKDCLGRTRQGVFRWGSLMKNKGGEKKLPERRSG